MPLSGVSMTSANTIAASFSRFAGSLSAASKGVSAMVDAKVAAMMNLTVYLSFVMSNPCVHDTFCASPADVLFETAPCGRRQRARVQDGLRAGRCFFDESELLESAYEDVHSRAGGAYHFRDDLSRHAGQRASTRAAIIAAGRGQQLDSP
jgi:hypothetical protein